MFFFAEIFVFREDLREDTGISMKDGPPYRYRVYRIKPVLPVGRTQVLI